MKPMKAVRACSSLLMMLLLAAFSSCHFGEPDGDAIPGVTPRHVYRDLPNRGMTLSESWDHETFRTLLQSFDRGVSQHLAVIGRNRLSVDSVRATAVADPRTGDIRRSLGFLGGVVTMTYTGSNPDRMRKWLGDHFTETEARTTEGPVEFILRAPDEYSRELLIRRGRR